MRFPQECDLVRRRFAAENDVTVRKPPEALNDLLVAQHVFHLLEGALAGAAAMLLGPAPEQGDGAGLVLGILGMMLMMELQFPEAMQQAIRAANLAEQIGHRRAAMISYHGLSFIYHEIGQPGLGPQADSAGLAIARSLGARRFIAEGLMLQAQSEFQVGHPQASKTIREANEIARETPSFMKRNAPNWDRSRFVV